MPILRFKPAVGGGEEHVYQLAKNLIKRGHEVKIYTSNVLKMFPRYEFIDPSCSYFNGIPVKRYRTIHVMKQYPILPGMFKDILDEKPDIIHAHGYGWSTTDFSSLISYCKSVPFVITTHGFFPIAVKANHLLTRLYIGYSRSFTLKIAKGIICVSDADAKIYRELTAPQKIVVIPNGIDLEYWRRLPHRGFFRGKHGISQPIIACVGRIVWGKGFQYLIRALPMVLQAVPDAMLVIAGEDFGYLNSLKRLCNKVGVTKHIFFAGYLSNRELKELYVDADMVAIPSIYEPFGIVALEAMACTKSIVAFKVGGLAEIISDGIDGVLVEHRNVDKLAMALVSLFNDRYLAKRLASEGVKKAERYSWDNVAKKTESLYFEVLKG